MTPIVCPIVYFNEDFEEGPRPNIYAKLIDSILHPGHEEMGQLTTYQLIILLPRSALGNLLTFKTNRNRQKAMAEALKNREIPTKVSMFFMFRFCTFNLAIGIRICGIPI